MLTIKITISKKQLDSPIHRRHSDSWVASASPQQTQISNSMCLSTLAVEIPNEEEAEIAEETNYMEEFRKYNIQNHDGRYVVKLPFLPGATVQPNYSSAANKLNQLIQQLHRKDTFSIYEKQKCTFATRPKREANIEVLIPRINCIY